MPLAERTGLIGPITHWVLAEALGQYIAGSTRGSTSIAVNLSAPDLLDESLPETIASCCRQRGPRRGSSCEITEGTVLADPQRADAILRALREIGVGL